MIIAATYQNGEIFQHFGHSEEFAVYETENGKITSSRIVRTNGSGHGALALFLSELNADMVICGGIGGGARGALMRAGIKLCSGCSGNAEEAVKKYLDGTLEYSENATCSHHDHGEGHSCGSSCGHHHDSSCGGHGNHSCGHGCCH